MYFCPKSQLKALHLIKGERTKSVLKSTFARASKCWTCFGKSPKPLKADIIKCIKTELILLYVNRRTGRKGLVAKWELTALEIMKREPGLGLDGDAINELDRK